MLVEMTVMHLMRPAYTAYVPVVASCEPFETLMNDHFMHNKISESIQRNTEAYCGNNICLLLKSEHDAEPTWNSEDEKEGVVLFKNPSTFLVMIAVQVP